MLSSDPLAAHVDDQQSFVLDVVGQMFPSPDQSTLLHFTVPLSLSVSLSYLQHVVVLVL